MEEDLKINFNIDDDMEDGLLTCNKETFKTLMCLLQDEIKEINYPMAGK